MRIVRWSELSVDMVCHKHEVMREVDANETSGELGSAFGGTLVVLSQLSIPKLDPLIESSILFPLVSVDHEYHVVRRCTIPITARAGWRGVDVGNDQLRIPYIRLYGKFFQVVIK